MTETTGSTSLPEGLLDLLRRPSPCLLSTTLADGSPHLTQTWVATDGEHVLVNTVRGYQKVRNVERDPRVSVAVLDPDDPSRYYSLRGTVLSVSEDESAATIESLSQRYTGGPYRNYGGGDQVRLLLTIRVDKVVHAPWG